MHKRSTAAIFAINSYAKRDEALKLAMEALNAAHAVLSGEEMSKRSLADALQKAQVASAAVKELLK
jgi:hypothetical protein